MKIFVAYDGSSFADIALYGLQSAGLPVHAEALVVSVVEPDRYASQTFGPTETVSREWGKRIEAATLCAETAAERLQTSFPRWDIQVETPSGHPGAMILDRADTWPADLIVIGTHGRSGLSRVVLGSISLRVIREARCSVRVGRASERKPEEPLRIVIGNDGSAQAAAAIDAVSRRIWPAGAEVRIIGVPQTLAPVDAASFALASHSLLAAETFLETDREERHRFGLVIDRSAKKLEDAGLTVSTLVEDGSPAQVIMRESRDWRADAIFVGANGIGRIERLLLGSVAESLVTHAPCTVEVVRSR